MTTRLKKQQRQAIIVVLSTIAFCTLIAIDATILRDTPYFWISMIFIYTILITWLTMNTRKYPIVLNEEEQKQPVTNEADFSNCLSWKKVLACEILVLYVFFTMFIPLKLGKTPVEIVTSTKELLSQMPVSWWILIIVSILAPIVLFLYNARNQYRIEGDTLIIHECRFNKWDEELRIPIATISNVYIKNRWNVGPQLFIEVNGIPRVLRATTHALELAVAILRHK